MQVTVFHSFEDLPREIRFQTSYPRVANFIHSLDWFETLFQKSFDRLATPRIYLVSDDQGQSVGVFYAATDSGTRTLRSMTNFYSVGFSPFIAISDEGRVDAIETLCKYLTTERPRWRTIELRCLLEDDSDSAYFLHTLKKNGFQIQSYFQYENWFANTRDLRFETYLEGRPSQLRNTLRRQAKKAAKNTAIRIDCVSAHTASLEIALRAYEQVYESSWKGHEAFPEFMRALADRCAALGILRLGWLAVEGEPAAAQFWITTPERAIVYKLAYAEKYREMSVGSLLSAYMFETALDEDKVCEIDYGVGSEPYKRDWMTEHRTLEGCVAYNTATFVGLCRTLAWRASMCTKKTVTEARRRWQSIGNILERD